MIKKYDVSVIGGGIIGLMFAAYLSALSGDLEICVVQDKQPLLDWPEEEWPERVSALNRSSQKLFEFLGLWDFVLQESSPYFHIDICDKASAGRLQFDRKEVLENDLGHIATNRILQKALWRHLSSNPQVDLITGLLPTAIDIQDQFVEISLGEKVFQSKLLVGADGAASWVHQHLKFERYERDYKQAAFIACVQTEASHDFTAIQYFFPNEVLAFLPLKNRHQSSIVWSAPPEKARYLMQCSSENLSQLLGQSIDGKLGKIEQVDKRNVFPLKMRHSKSYAKERVALIGDAIHTIHPLAGQGMNLGLADARCLSEIIKETHGIRRDIGGITMLNRYERFRKSDNWKMVLAMDAIKGLFSDRMSWSLPLRKLGMRQIDKYSFIKKYFIQEALGES